MREQEHTSPPLWVIKFEPPLEGIDWQKQAHLQFLGTKKEPPKDSLSSLESQHLALDFLEKINNSFREMTDAYLKKFENDAKQQSQIKEIRQNFESFDQWLDWIRTLLKNPPKKEDIDPKDFP